MVVVQVQVCRFICSDSGFYDCLDYYDEVMADRGFQINEELMMKYCTLSVPPPGARLKSQMTKKECKKNKRYRKFEDTRRTSHQSLKNLQDI